MEHVGYYLHQLPGNQIDAIREQVRRVAEYARKQKGDTEVVDFFAEFLENFVVGEDDE